MFSLHALVDSSCAESFETIKAALVALGVRPIRMAGLEGLARLVNRVKVSSVFLNWDADRSHLAARIVRQSKSNGKVPITMVTSSAATSVVADAARQGVNFFLTKPLNQSQVEQNILQQLPFMHDERRSYQRLPLSLPVACGWGGDQEHAGQSINISASGMLLLVEPQPAVGDRVVVSFGNQDLDSEFTVEAEVVRSDPQERVGIQYLWQSTSEHEQLKASLEQKLSEQAPGN